MPCRQLCGLLVILSFLSVTACDNGRSGPPRSDAGPPVVCLDADGDGVAISCSDGSIPEEIDCDDSDPASFPGNAELCDGVDQDCDSFVDEDQSTCLACDAGACVTPAHVAAGRRHACAVMTDGTLYCWGANPLGELGTPDVAIAPSAIRVTSRVDFVEVDSEVSLTCARAADSVLCWGLGVSLPYEMPVPADTARIEVSGTALCTLSSTGGVACRYRDRTELGVLPRDAKTYALGGMVDLAVAGSIACGLSDVGAVVCWDLSLMIPTDYVLAAAGGEWLTDGGGQICGVIAGELQCWSSLTEPTAVLGMGTAVDALMSRSTRCARGSGGALSCWLGALGTVTIAPEDQVALGDGFGCLIDSSSYIRCWGSQADGAVGNGVVAARDASPVPPSAGTELATLSEVAGASGAPGACHDHSDISALHASASAVVIAAEACATECAGTLEPAVCTDACRGGSLDALLTPSCGDCFLDFATGAGGSTAYETLTECVGYRWAFLEKATHRIPGACRLGECTGFLGMGQTCGTDEVCASQQCGLPAFAGAPRVCLSEWMSNFGRTRCAATVDVAGTQRCTLPCDRNTICPDRGTCVGSRSSGIFWCRENCTGSRGCDLGTCEPLSDFSSYYCD